MPNIEQEILTEREVSDWLGLSEPTLFRHRRDGTGPTFIRLSARRVAYRRSAVEAWLSHRERHTISGIDDPRHEPASSLAK
jgi:predicted DNA-binding transcriptional regulator AlpA